MFSLPTAKLLCRFEQFQSLAARRVEFVATPALTPALSLRRGRILRRVLGIRAATVVRKFSPANHQPSATGNSTLEFSKRVRSLFPLPGGEGQGEGERHTNFFTARNQGKGMNGKGIKTKSGEFCFPIPVPFIPLPCVPFHPARNSVRGMIVRGIKTRPEKFFSPIPLTIIPLTHPPLR